MPAQNQLWKYTQSETAYCTSCSAGVGFLVCSKLGLNDLRKSRRKYKLSAVMFRIIFYECLKPTLLDMLKMCTQSTFSKLNLTFTEITVTFPKSFSPIYNPWFPVQICKVLYCWRNKKRPCVHEYRMLVWVYHIHSLYTGLNSWPRLRPVAFTVGLHNVSPN